MCPPFCPLIHINIFPLFSIQCKVLITSTLPSLPHQKNRTLSSPHNRTFHLFPCRFPCSSSKAKDHSRFHIEFGHSLLSHFKKRRPLSLSLEPVGLSSPSHAFSFPCNSWGTAHFPIHTHEIPPPFQALDQPSCFLHSTEDTPRKAASSH